MTGESEFEGVGVELSGVFGKPKAALTAQEKRQLAMRTGIEDDPYAAPSERALHGQSLVEPIYPLS